MKISVVVVLTFYFGVCFGMPDWGQGWLRDSRRFENRRFAQQSGYEDNKNEGYGVDDGYDNNDGYRKNEGYGKINGYRQNVGYENNDGYVQKDTYVVKDTYQKKDYKPKQCYQCAYSPPKTYYKQKVHVEKHQYERKDGYEPQNNYVSQGYNERNDGYGRKQRSYGGYVKKTYVPVPYTVQGGWDKCMGPFDHYQAKDFGVDVWDCHSNCYTRRDPTGDVYRGCYKGEYGVDPHRYGCSKQAGAIWCFCEGEKCNNEAAPEH